MLLGERNVSACCFMVHASYEMDLTTQLSRAKSQTKRWKEDGVHGDSFDLKTGVC